MLWLIDMCRLKVTVTYTEPSTGMPKETPKYYRFSIVDLFGFNYRPVFVKVCV